jgi:hypothetical protein
MKKHICALFIMFIFLNHCFGQSPADCDYAIKICDTIYTAASLNDDPNNIPNEINPLFSCLGQGESSGRWYKFKSTGSGVLNFTIVPTDTTYDLDWSLFNLNNRNCSDIWSDPAMEIACNFYGVNNNNGSTGANGITGGQNTPVINVDSSTQFYLFISTYQLGPFDTLGYQIDFTASTIEFMDCENMNINSVNADKKIKLYPIPATDVLYYSSIDPIQSVLISDVQGKNYATKLNSGSIDISFLPSGVYFVQFNSTDERIIKKIIKQ